ncbi:hypothetical protein BGW80DRAFT_49012 [Lactifluus volemus]|nr:hypothetical protein BGW80DRAFT_49012 [Lactifluus volemus]
MLGRELFPQSPVSPQRGPSDDRSPAVASPSSVTLTDVPNKGPIASHSRTQSRRSTDAGPSTLSRVNSLASDPHSVASGPSRPRVVIRQASSILQPPSPRLHLHLWTFHTLLLKVPSEGFFSTAGLLRACVHSAHHRLLVCPSLHLLPQSSTLRHRWTSAEHTTTQRCQKDPQESITFPFEGCES